MWERITRIFWTILSMLDGKKSEWLEMNMISSSISTSDQVQAYSVVDCSWQVCANCAQTQSSLSSAFRRFWSCQCWATSWALPRLPRSFQRRYTRYRCSDSRSCHGSCWCYKKQAEWAKVHRIWCRIGWYVHTLPIWVLPLLLIGLGIVKQLRDAVISLDKVSKEEANAKFFLVDKYGLIKESLGPDKIRSDLQEFVRSDNEWKDVAVNERQEIELLEVVKKVKPTVLIGCSTHAGGFTKEVVTVMAEDVDRPIILPLSNPSKLVEVEPQYANEWTKGKALIATGSPFPPVKLLNGNEYVWVKSQKQR